MIVKTLLILEDFYVSQKKKNLPLLKKLLYRLLIVLYILKS